MLSFECIKNEKSVYFLLTSANTREVGQHKKLDKTFDLSNFYICKFDVTTSDAILTFSIFEYIL